MQETWKVDNNKIRKALFVSLCPLYVMLMRYLEECSRIGHVILSSVVADKEIRRIMFGYLIS